MSTYATAVLADSPISFWELGETSGTAAADSADSNGGTYTGGFTLNNSGPSANTTGAASVNGSTGFVDCGSAANLAFGNTFSIDGWINTTSDGAIISHGNSSWYLRVSGGVLQYVRSQVAVQVTGNTQVSTGQWRHVGLAVNSSGNGQLYVDGMPDSQNVGNNVGAASQHVTIGCETNGSGVHSEFFNGSLYGIAAYGATLGWQTFANHYGVGIGGQTWRTPCPPRGPAGYRVRRPYLLARRGCVLYAPCGEPAGVATIADVFGFQVGSVNGRTGAAPGQYGQAFACSGASATFPSFALGPPGSIECLVAVTGYGTADSNGNCGVWGNISSTDSGGWEVYYSIRNGQLFSRYINGSTAGGSFGRIQLGRMYHAVFTYDGTNYANYLDGQLVATGSTANAAAGARQWVLGYKDTGSGVFGGNVALAAAYNKVLSASEVQRMARDPFEPMRGGVTVAVLNAGAQVLPSSGPILMCLA